MHNGTIIAEVNKRARANWHIENGPIADNPVTFRAHWIEQGKLWAKECRDQGLEETAKTIEKHIEWFERQQNE